MFFSTNAIDYIFVVQNVDLVWWLIVLCQRSVLKEEKESLGLHAELPFRGVLELPSRGVLKINKLQYNLLSLQYNLYYNLQYNLYYKLQYNLYYELYYILYCIPVLHLCTTFLYSNTIICTNLLPRPRVITMNDPRVVRCIPSRM